MNRLVYFCGIIKLAFDFFPVPHGKIQPPGLSAGLKKCRGFDGGLANFGQVQLEIVFAFAKQFLGIAFLKTLKFCTGLAFAEQPQGQWNYAASRTEERNRRFQNGSGSALNLNEKQVAPFDKNPVFAGG